MARTNLHCVCSIPTFTFPLMAVQTRGDTWLDKRQTFPSTSDKRRLLNRPMWEVVPEAGKWTGTAGCIFFFFESKWDRVI